MNLGLPKPKYILVVGKSRSEKSVSILFFSSMEKKEEREQEKEDRVKESGTKKQELL